MKTNHQRDFKAEKDTPQNEGTFHLQEKLPLSGESISDYIHVGRVYHDSIAKARRGAKAHMNKRARIKENHATQKLADSPNDES